MATIRLQGVEKRFGESYAVKPLDLEIASGEFVVLLGPSGCGKTTTLRMISGLEAVSAGRITFDGEDVTWAGPSERDIAFVFQFFALYSHMSARENIAFPLQARGAARSEVNARVEAVAKLLRIAHLLDKRPGALSGGDQQRVALARALVRKPAAFLMDEPLGALDAEFRDAMRAEIKRLHLEQDATTVYVTHDQIEAMAMGDKIVVMSAAEIQQIGTPLEVYNDPANLFVARFIGSPGMNLLSGRLEDACLVFPGGARYRVPAAWRGALERSAGKASAGKEVVLGFRPEAVRLGDGTSVSDRSVSGNSVSGNSAGGSGAGIPATVYASALHGGHSMLHLDIGAEGIIHARAERKERRASGSRLHFGLDPDLVRFFDPASGLALRREVA